MKIFLRNLKHSDTDILLETENDETLWDYSIQDKPFSKTTIKNYIKNASVQSIIEAKQKRFVISSSKVLVIGFIDLFNYDLIKGEAHIGIVVLKNYRSKGIGYDSIQLLESYCIGHLKLEKLFASIDSNNLKSIKLFIKSGYTKKHNDLYEKNIK